MHARTRGLSLFASACLLAFVTPAFAQTAAPNSVLEEVVVTAQRRQERLQDVPAAVQALTAGQLQSLGVVDTRTLQTQVPGLLVGQGNGLVTQVYLRGIGSNISGVATGNSVATYVDGVYIPNVIQSFQTFNDVERIEVLKGPQAVLYGRNATGGAINVILQEPKLTPGGRIDLQAGNYDTYGARASVTGPLVADKLAGRLSVSVFGHDGYDKLLNPAGQVFSRSDLQRTRAVRGALKAFLTSDLDVTVSADYMKDMRSDFARGANPAAFTFFFQPVRQFSPNTREMYADYPSRQPLQDWGGNIRLRWTAPIGTLTSITSYRDFKSGPAFNDLDNTAGQASLYPTVAGPYDRTLFPPALFPSRYAAFRVGYVGEKVRSQSVFHETWLATDASQPLSMIVGATAFDEHATNLVLRDSGTVRLSFDRDGTARAYAAYADASYRLTSTLTVSAGGRYSTEKRRYEQTQLNPTTGAPLRNAAGQIIFASNRRRWSDFTPRVGIKYQPNADLLLYANATSGFKSGGFNESDPTNSFQPEKVWSYEGGVKSTWLDGRLRANLSAFYYDYKDLQVEQIIDLGGFFARRITNAATAKLYGLDAELAARPMDPLVLGLNLSLLHSEYGDFIACDDLRGLCTATDRSGFVNVKGNQLQRAPKVSLNTYAEYTLPVGGSGASVTFHGDASYTSRTYYNLFVRKYDSMPAYWLFNANVRYDLPSGLSFGAYVLNIANKTVITYAQANVTRVGTTTFFSPSLTQRYAAPRTYGVRASYAF